jgi:hypothetical protein
MKYDPHTAAVATDVKVFVLDELTNDFTLKYSLPVGSFSFEDYHKALIEAIEAVILVHLLYLKENGYKPEEVNYVHEESDPMNVIRIAAYRIVATKSGFKNSGFVLGIVQFPAYCRIVQEEER